MSGRSIFDSPTVPRLMSVLEEVRSGRLLLPDFQRPFVWDDDRRLLLLDSVAKGMPTGSFLVWRTREHKLKTLEWVGPFRIPRADEQPAATHTYLLDGHQRLTTLFATLNWSDEDGADVDARFEAEAVRWPVYYDLDPDPEVGGFTLLRRRQTQAPLTWLPLSILLVPKRLYAFQKKLMDAGEVDASERAEALANSVKDYQIPIVPLVSEDLDLVTDSFVRVNSQGKPMRETHMVRALAYSRFNVEDRLVMLRERLAARGWGELDDQILLNTLKIRFGLDIYEAGPRELHEKLQEHGYEETLDALEGSVGHAVDLLCSFGVRGAAALPYAYQLTSLAEASRGLSGPLGEEHAEPLERWFWATTYAGYFTGMTSSRIRAAVDHVVKLVCEGGPVIPTDLVDEEIPALRRYHYRATRTRAFVLQLSMLIDDDDARAAAQRRLGDIGAAAVDRLILGERGDEPANRVVAASAEELGALREALMAEATPEHEALLVRYGVPAEAQGYVRAGKVDAFFDARRRALDEMERRFVESLSLRFVGDAGDDAA